MLQRAVFRGDVMQPRPAASAFRVDPAELEADSVRLPPDAGALAGTTQSRGPRGVWLLGDRNRRDRGRRCRRHALAIPAPIPAGLTPR